MSSVMFSMTPALSGTRGLNLIPPKVILPATFLLSILVPLLRHWPWLSSIAHRISFLTFWPWHPNSPDSLHTSYASVEDEQRYWIATESYRLYMETASARTVPSTPSSGPVLYYEPRLPPIAHGVSERHERADAYLLSPRTFSKWHRMVFPRRPHPTLAQARHFVRNLSARDRRAIRRIARMLPDSKVFVDIGHQGAALHHRIASGEFLALWRTHLSTKGPDIVVVFE